MYAIDINFLNDREVIDMGVDRQSISIPDSQFMIIGVAVAAVALLGAVGFHFWTDSQVKTLEAKKAELEAKKAEVERQAKELQELEQQITQIQARNQQLTTLFVGQLPTYAILSELSRRTPDTIQIDNYIQTDTPTGSTVQISGTGKDYEVVNDFFLLIQSSPFFDPAQTKLQSATQGQGRDARVSFIISTALTKRRADELKDKLAEAGVQGLLVRLNKLIERQVLSPPAPAN